MKIVDFLPVEVVEPDLKANDRTSVLSALISLLAERYEGLDADEILRVMEEREKLGSTGIGEGVAIPHGKVKGLKKVLLAMGLSKEGIDFDSIDGKPAHVFFLIAAPENSVGVHLSLLARINKISGDPESREKIMKASDAREIRNAVDRADREG